ncbi:MAG: GDP-L-fucose synthase [bacterium]
MNRGDRIFVAGHAGLVGSAIVRRLQALGFGNLLVRSRRELDLTDGRAVTALFQAERPHYVFFAAAKVGGIMANQAYPADFIRENLLVQTSVIDAALAAQVKKLLFLGSSCVYPKFADQPIRESSLLTGALEPTNEAYAIAKIAGIITCQSFNRQHGTRYISAMPTNLYGENDNFHNLDGHVLPVLLRRVHDAKITGAPDVTVWGSGTPRREFLHVDDLADACVHLMQHWAEPTADGSLTGGPDAVNQIVNIGFGEDISIRELAELIKELVGYEGELRWDSSKPDGTPRKLLDSTRLHATGWTPAISLRDGIARTYAWFLAHEHEARLGT